MISAFKDALPVDMDVKHSRTTKNGYVISPGRRPSNTGLPNHTPPTKERCITITLTTQYKEHELSKHSDNPEIRWWNGHFITGLELKNQVMK